MECNFIEFEEPSPFGATNESGVYGVFITYGSITKCLYIGSSKNILYRLSNINHPYRILFNRLSNYRTFVYTRQIKCLNYKLIEKELIIKYKPFFNKIRYGA